MAENIYDLKGFNPVQVDQAYLRNLGIESAPPSLVRLFERLLGGVERLAERRSGFRRQLAHFLAGRGQRAFAAQRLDPRRFEFVDGTRRANPFERTANQFPYGIF